MLKPLSHLDSEYQAVSLVYLLNYRNHEFLVKDLCSNDRRSSVQVKCAEEYWRHLLNDLKHTA